MKSVIVDQFGHSFEKPPVTHVVSGAAGRMMRAGFDAAILGDTDLKHHWAMADSKSPNFAASEAIRKTLRTRGRLESKNNSFCRGMVNTLANDAIGRGPRLQMLTESRKENAAIERDWKRWSRAIFFAQKLRQMRISKAVDGEGLAITVTNRRAPVVSLDIRLLECDHLEAPLWGREQDETQIDGVGLDTDGNPIRYYLLDHHPGDMWSMPEGRWYPRGRVFHYYNADRPEQHRGIPEITPALPMFALLRRYTLAVLAAAETAADISAVLRTQSGVDVTAAQVDPFLPIQMERRAMLSVPAGWDLTQLRAEQPTTTFVEFRDALLNEIARCLHMPFNVAAGNSSDYNYASGRLDHQVYHRAIKIERETIEAEILDRIFELWILEYLANSRRVRPSSVDIADFPHAWVWDGFGHVDPVKEASAVEVLWRTGLITDEDYWLEQGMDPETMQEKLARQRVRREANFLPLPGVAEQLIRVNERGQRMEDDEQAPRGRRNGSGGRGAGGRGSRRAAKAVSQ